jgi:dienelactone hydrolase
MRRSIQLTIEIAVVALLLAACGGAPAQPSGGSATAAPAASASAPTAAIPLAPTIAPATAVTDALFDYDAQAVLDIQEIGAGKHDAGFITHDVSFASPKGGRVPAYLVVPDGPGPFAGILLMPGSGGIRGGPLLPYAQDLAKTGVVSLLMDGPEARFPHDGPLFRWTEEDRAILVQYVIDLRRGVDLLTARPEVDPKRLGYIGIGFSGAMGGVLAGVDKRIKAYVLNAAPANYVAEIMVPSHPLYPDFHEVPQAQQQRWAATYDPVQPDHRRRRIRQQLRRLQNT